MKFATPNVATDVTTNAFAAVAAQHIVSMNESNLKNDWKTSGNPFPFCSASEPHAKRGVGDLALLALDLARRR